MRNKKYRIYPGAKLMTRKECLEYQRRKGIRDFRLMAYSYLSEGFTADLLIGLIQIEQEAIETERFRERLFASIEKHKKS